MSITEDQFRKTLGLFPTGVAVVTSPYGQEDACLTISSLTSVSLNPLQILFCLSKKSKTSSVFTTCSYFSLNILNADQSYVADSFATRTPPAKPLKVYRHEETGCLLFSDALAHIICERGPIYDGGDHHIILGRVIDLGANPNNLPLVRQRGQYLTTQPLLAKSMQKMCQG